MVKEDGESGDIINKKLYWKNSVNSSDKPYLMKEVILKPLHHRGQECIGIYFENSFSLNGAIRKQAGAK